jgi:thymidylate kinase
MWIEFLGGVGSGKSSLATALRERFQAADFPVWSPQEAFQNRVKQALPKAISYGRPGHAAKRALLAGYQARFSVKHPKLVWQAWTASRDLDHLPGWHRNLIFNLFLEVAGWYEGLSDNLPAKSMVVVDEGLAHRSINLFAWQTGELDTKAIQSYVESLPEVPLTILVIAPMEVSLERAHNRGLPMRLRGKDTQTIRRFIENSHAVASLAGKVLMSKGGMVIKIENSLELEQSIAMLYKQITETALFQKYFTQHYQASFVKFSGKTP